MMEGIPDGRWIGADALAVAEQGEQEQSGKGRVHGGRGR
jgi:hypothetical protein